MPVGARIVVAIAAACLGAGCGVPATTTVTNSSTVSSTIVHPSNAPTKKYVALGSSYAAGPGGIRLTDMRCARSEGNYPSLVAQSLGLQLTDVSCSGATTADIVDRAQPGVADRPQIDAVTADTSLVTLTVGGNNIHYVGRLMALSCRAVGPIVGARAEHCNSSPPPPPAAADFAHLSTTLHRVLQAIRDRAPQATIVFVDYLPLTTGDATCDVLPLSPEQRAETLTVYAGLTKAIATAANSVGAEVVRMSTAGHDHGVCSADPWLYGYESPAPYHETPSGKAAIAATVAKVVGASA
ncbi:SGNH/GDSL hydrolase family protein [Gordonia sp. DT30]|uniref:SGNH/GDSL hydrolase family protein n=1 Tax=unclassified Gordonia (in: high G+C Gram-positive bacteria) TaxID=2657482 RepID=UPI003CF093B3